MLPAKFVASGWMLPRTEHLLGGRMARRISMATRNELVAALADRYARSSRTERSVILDEFVPVSGYHRKHAIRLLRGEQGKRAVSARRGAGVWRGRVPADSSIIVSRLRSDSTSPLRSMSRPDRHPVATVAHRDWGIIAACRT